MPPGFIVSERVAQDKDYIGIRLRMLPHEMDEADKSMLEKLAAAYKAASKQAMADLVTEACRAMSAAAFASAPTPPAQESEAEAAAARAAAEKAEVQKAGDAKANADS